MNHRSRARLRAASDGAAHWLRDRTSALPPAVDAADGRLLAMSDLGVAWLFLDARAGAPSSWQWVPGCLAGSIPPACRVATFSLHAYVWRARQRNESSLPRWWSPELEKEATSYRTIPAKSVESRWHAAQTGFLRWTLACDEGGRRTIESVYRLARSEEGGTVFGYFLMHLVLYNTDFGARATTLGDCSQQLGAWVDRLLASDSLDLLAECLLACVCAGAPLSSRAVQRLLEAQNSDGSIRAGKGEGLPRNSNLDRDAPAYHRTLVAGQVFAVAASS